MLGHEDSKLDLTFEGKNKTYWWNTAMLTLTSYPIVSHRASSPEDRMTFGESKTHKQISLGSTAARQRRAANNVSAGHTDTEQKETEVMGHVRTRGSEPRSASSASCRIIERRRCDPCTISDNTVTRRRAEDSPGGYLEQRKTRIVRIRRCFSWETKKRGRQNKSAPEMQRKNI